MAIFKKRKLSGSTDGKPIKVVATATAGTTIHTAVAGTTAGTFDEIWLEATNNDTQARILTLEIGGAEVEYNCVINIPSKAGFIRVLDGKILQNGMVLKAFASAANVISLDGYVNYMTD
jgi:hypothetical protein